MGWARETGGEKELTDPGSESLEWKVNNVWSTLFRFDQCWWSLIVIDLIETKQIDGGAGDNRMHNLCILINVVNVLGKQICLSLFLVIHVLPCHN